MIKCCIDQLRPPNGNLSPVCTKHLIEWLFHVALCTNPTCNETYLLTMEHRLLVQQKLVCHYQVILIQLTLPNYQESDHQFDEVIVLALKQKSLARSHIQMLFLQVFTAASMSAFSPSATCAITSPVAGL